MEGDRWDAEGMIERYRRIFGVGGRERGGGGRPDFQGVRDVI